MTEKRKIWYAANKKRLQAKARLKYKKDPHAFWVKNLKYKYNLTEDQYWQIFAEQGGKCKLTGLPPEPGQKLSVDHDHKTGKVRGLLRKDINMAIGGFNDDPDLLRKAADYVEKHK